MKSKRLLTYILLSNLICVFPAGHAILFLGLFEPILLAGALSGNNESPALWTVSAILLLTGQILILLALLLRVEKRVNQLGVVGVFLLIFASISVYYALHEQVWAISLLTAVPFIIVSWIFLRRTLLKY